MTYKKMGKIRPADTWFSKYVRAKWNWTCVRCGTNWSHDKGKLDNSHFWGRWHESTRFEENNCDPLCGFFTPGKCHHHWGGDDRKEYDAYKLEQLGQERFDSLIVQKVSITKRYSLDAQVLIWTKLALKEMSEL